MAEHAFDALKAPIMRVARPAVPVAFSPPLEALRHAECRQDRRGGEEGDAGVTSAAAKVATKSCAVFIRRLGGDYRRERATRRRLLQGQDAQPRGRLWRRRRLRRLCAAAGTPYRPPHRRHADGHRAEHAGRGIADRAAPPGRDRPQGRHRRHAVRFRADHQRAAQSGADEARPRPLQLHRQHQRGPERLLRLAHARDRHARRLQEAPARPHGADRRRQHAGHPLQGAEPDARA